MSANIINSNSRKNIRISVLNFLVILFLSIFIAILVHPSLIKYLNLYHTIIKAHKGKIEVKSILSKGITFSLILPCIEEADEEELI